MPSRTSQTLPRAVNEQTYPSGRVVKNALDADGSLALVQSRKNSSDILRPFASNFLYNAAGAVTAMRLGNGRWENTEFNSRLQPTKIGLGSGVSSQSLLKLEYSYGTTANNGNVLGQTITVKRPGQSDLVFDQTYSYDSLNRITSAEEKTGTTTNWLQTYTFDRYGNRNFDEANTTTLEKNCGTAPNYLVCSADVPIINPSVNTANNRLTGTTYDAAGNVITDAEGRQFTYDAENKQIEAKNSSNATIGTYYFDGDGKRIKKVVPGTGEVTIFVYDASGKLIQEHSTIVASSQDAKTQYLTNDHLRTPRINTNVLGSVVSRSDYMPYGEEIVGLGNRSSNDKYVADDIRQGFTGYERDGETELDFALARNYSAILGRFWSTDASSRSVDLQMPQSWNRFTYCYNNPGILVDENGKWPTHIHNLIIDLALPGLSGSKRQVIKKSSLDTDMEKDAWDPKNAFKHGMRAPDQSADAAARSTSTWISHWIGKASAASTEDERLKAFGVAFHAVSDMTSPEHEGYQPWRPLNTGRGIVEGGLHALGESGASFYRQGLAIGATRRLYRETFGNEALARATGSRVYGSANDPIVQEIDKRSDMTGASERERGEAIYLYRIGLARGENFNWDDMRERRPQGERR